MNRPLSYSQVSTWLRCPKLYEYRYILKADPEKVGMALLLGGAVHDAVGAEAQRRLEGADGGLDYAVRSFREMLLVKVELPEATGRLAKDHGFNPGRVTIRNQRTRWGSCSSTGAISLNWRLIQVPAFVRDYVILHELIHLDHLNHSIQFWERLAKACPNLNAAEAWLKLHGNRIC